MSYTSIATSRPGPRLQAAQTSEELGALMLEVWAVVNANGGETPSREQISPVASTFQSLTIQMQRHRRKQLLNSLRNN